MSTGAMSASQMRLRREDTSPSPDTTSASASVSEFSSDSWSEVGAGDDLATNQYEDILRDAITGDLEQQSDVVASGAGRELLVSLFGGLELPLTELCSPVYI
jgi:hypothetical protein